MDDEEILKEVRGLHKSAAERFTAEFDNQARILLERNNIKWTNNIEELKRRLDEKGYRLESETNRELMKSTTHTFYLVKIIDKQSITVNFTLERPDNA